MYIYMLYAINHVALAVISESPAASGLKKAWIAKAQEGIDSTGYIIDIQYPI